jgi:aminoglycoside phosphotransferase (APT) family kinase protein
MSGAWLEHPQLRATPWLSRGLLRSWVANAGAQIDLLEHPTLATHPLLRELYSAPLVADVQQLWAERERFFAGLERLPQTLCHHDLWRHNLAARPGSAVQPQTVVLDWEVAGLGAPGEDVGNLLGVSLLNFDLPAEQAAAAAETLLSEYLAGLRSTGRACAADEAAAVRGAFAAAAALRCVFSTACWPAAIALDESGRFRAETEQRWRRPIETIFAQWASVTRFLLEQAAAARRWLKL